MSRSDERGVRPQRSSALAEDEVLAALVEHEWEEMNGVEIAARSRVPTATANRIITRMMSTGLLTHRYAGKERLVRIDVTSPLYRSTVERLWVRLGIQPSRPTPALAGLGVAEYGRPSGMGPFSAVDGVPPSLCQVAGAGSQADVDDGPLAPMARSLVLDLQALAGRCGWMRNLLMDAASDSPWRTTRDEDLWHRTGDGSRVGQAAQVLRRTTARSPRDANRRDDHELHAPERVGQRAWTLATYAVAAEASSYRAQEKQLDMASRAGRDRYIAQSDAASARESRARATTEEERQRGDADVATEEAKAEKVEAAITKSYHLYSAWQHVGTAGERLLAAESKTLAAQADEIAASMADQECVKRWQQDNAEESALYPLPRHHAGAADS